MDAHPFSIYSISSLRNNNNINININLINFNNNVQIQTTIITKKLTVIVIVNTSVVIKTSITTDKQTQTPVLIALKWIWIQGTHYVMPKSNLIEWLITALLFFLKPMSIMTKFMTLIYTQSNIAMSCTNVIQDATQN